jgi:hypothetical protein
MSMTRFERILDAVHNFSVALARITKPRWHLDRDRLVSLFGIGTVLVAGVSAAVPQLKGLAVVANLLAALQRTSAEIQHQLSQPATPPATDTVVPVADGPPDLRVVPPVTEPTTAPSQQSAR